MARPSPNRHNATQNRRMNIVAPAAVDADLIGQFPPDAINAINMPGRPSIDWARSKKLRGSLLGSLPSLFVQYRCSL